MDLNRILASRRIPLGAREWLVSQRRRLKPTLRRMSKPSTIPLLIMLVALPVLGIVNVFNAHAQPGTMVASGVTLPNSPVWLNGALGGHWWVSDGANGFCRLDPDPANAGQLVENLGTCDLTAAAAAQVAVGPVFTNPDASQHRFVYIADSGSKSFGPVRVQFDLATETIAAGSGVIMGAQNAAVPTCDNTFCTAGKGSFRSNAVALGPAGELYVAFIRSTNIVRIANAAGTVSTQTTTIIAHIDFPRPLGASALAVFFHAPDATHTTAWGDLYIAELTADGVSVITDLSTCGACFPTINPNITSFSPFGLAADGGIGDDGTIQPSTRLFVGEAPVDGPSSVLRYDPVNNIQDLYTSTVPTFTSPFNGASVSNYLSITGLGLRQDTGELFIGDDPTVNEVNPPAGMGHLWSVAAGGALDCAGTPIAPCAPLAAPATISADIYAYGMQSPIGGAVLPNANGDRHLWMAGEGAGFCRLDIVPQAPALHATNFDSCDDATIGALAQIVADPTPNADGTTFIYVADPGRFSLGVWRVTYDPAGDGGNGAISNPTLLAPTSNLGAIRPASVAVGPDGALYMAFPKADAGGTIKKITNPRDDPRTQTVVGVANSSDGGGVAGDMAFLGSDLYLGEGAGFSVVRNITACTSTALCTASILPIGTVGGTPAAGVAADPVRNLIYGLASPGAGPATVFQFDPVSQTSRVYVTQGRVPAAGSPEATSYCALTCTRNDPTLIPGGTSTFPNACGIAVDPETGTVFIMDDPTGGGRFGLGHIWSAPFQPMPPAPPAPTPTATPTTPPAPAPHTCSVTINVPSLASGNSYWVQFTAHSAGPISATWTIPIAQSAQLLLYTGNPFAGLADPIKKGPTGKPIAVQNTSNTQSFAISVSSQPAGTYTVQFFNGSNSFVATTGTISYVNDGNTACPVSPTSQNILN
jgi:hypothetical protein